MTVDFDLGTVATYSCNEGYQLISGPGGDSRTCVDGGDGNGGVFNGVSPSCERKILFLAIREINLTYLLYICLSHIQLFVMNYLH